MNDFDQPEGNDETEEGESNTAFIEDGDYDEDYDNDFLLNDSVDISDLTERQKELVKKDRYQKVKRNKQAILGKLKQKLLLGDGQNSEEIIRNIEPKLNGSIYFKDHAVVTKDGEFYNNQYGKNFRTMFELAVGEHNGKTVSMVERAVGIDALEENTEAILDDTRETQQIEAVVIYDEIDRLITYNPEAVSKQEMREIRGLKHIRGTPLVKLRAAIKDLGYYREKLEEARSEGNEKRVRILRTVMEYVEKQVIILEVNLGQVPKSEEGKQHVQEIIENDIRTKFERFRKWAKENLGAIAAIAISIAGIITTVVVAGKKAIVGASKGLGAVGKALAGLSKSALPILVPFLNLLSTILSWGAKGLAFLAKNLWIVAILIAVAIYKYLQMKRKK